MIVLVAAAAPVPGQASPGGSNGWAVEPLPGPGGAAVVVAWLHRDGERVWHDAGTAAVLAHVRMDRALASVQHLQAGVYVDADVACVTAVAERAAHAGELATFAAALLDDGRPIADDAIAVASARAALQADDLEFVQPAGVFARAAWQHAGAASPFGSGAAMLALPPARVRELLGDGVPTFAAARGVIGDELAAALRRLPLRPCALPLPASPVRWPVAAGEPIASVTHSRVDQPFVLAAFPAPAAADRAALAVACEVARARAVRRFPLHGSEPRAGTWFVAWSWLSGDACVRFHRRGRDPVRLWPTERAWDAAAECEATAAELRAFLADLRQRPPTAEEVSKACTTVLAETGLAPAVRQRAEPAALGGRLRNTLLASLRGIDAAAVGSVTPAAAGDVLAAVLAEGAGHWRALLPQANPQLGWRPR